MTFIFRFLISIFMVATITACGKKPVIKDNSNKTPSPSSSEKIYFHVEEIKRSILENDLASIKTTLFQYPEIDLDQTLSDGDTFLIRAIKEDHWEIRDFFIDKGASLEKTNINNNVTPLMVAAMNNLGNTVQVLVDRKVDLEKINSNGDTALHLAILHHHDEIALSLIKNGARVNTINLQQKDAYQLATESDVPQSLELLKSIQDIETGSPDIASFRAILLQADHKRLSSVLSKHPQLAVDPLYVSLNPLALLMDSKDENSAHISAEILLKNRADVNGPLGADTTPLIKAVSLRRKGFANLFLTTNANPQLMDKNGKSALIHAIELNDLELVELLLAYSAVEKYTFRKNGKKITYNACKVVKETGKNLTRMEEIVINEEIKKSLSCGYFSWLF